MSIFPASSRLSRHLNPIGFLLLSALSNACTAPPSDAGTETNASAQALLSDTTNDDNSSNSNCGGGCGTNSPTVGDGLFFDEVDSDPTQRNAAGLSLTRAWLVPELNDNGIVGPDRPVRIQVRGDTLEAIPLDNGPPISPPKNVIMAFTHKDGREYHVLINDVTFTDFLAYPDARAKLPVYDLRVLLHQPPRNQTHGSRVLTSFHGQVYWGYKLDRVLASYPGHSLCTGDARDISARTESLPFQAVVFAGDHYDNLTKTVSDAEPSTTRFNIGCMGTALAKMHLSRHTNAGALRVPAPKLKPEFVVAPLSMRQAMLKMLTGDYCGSGDALTLQGTQISYKDTLYRTVDFPKEVKVKELEAIWDAAGARCLNTPRILSRDEVEQVCAFVGRETPPRCSQEHLDSCLGKSAQTTFNIPGAQNNIIDPTISPDCVFSAVPNPKS